jgi:hypothetical protein
VNDFPLQNAVELCPLERHSETRVNHIDVSAMHESLRRAAHNGETGVVQRIPSRAVRGANSPGSFSTAQAGVCDASSPEASIPTRWRPHCIQSFQAFETIAIRSVGVARNRLGSRGTRAETGA